MNSITPREAVAEYVAAMLAAAQISNSDLVEFLRAGNREIANLTGFNIDEQIDADTARAAASKVFTEIV